MIELKSVSWRNFLSYGDYITELDLSNLGQCLVTGRVIDDDDNLYDGDDPISAGRSNGAGKSTIPNVIQWVLFGRTMHNPNPGSKVLNWFSKGNCWARVEFKCGDAIERVRTRDGKTELMYMCGGDVERLTADTVSTAANQQAKLASKFNLDWDFFCGSAFFNQYSKSWLEMTDQARRKAIERLLRVDKFIYRARVAKTKYDLLDRQMASDNDAISELDAEIHDTLTLLDELHDASQKHADSIKARKRKLLLEAAEIKKARDKLVVPNIDALQKRWKTIEIINDKIRTVEAKADELYDEIRTHSAEAKLLESNIASWQKEAGSVCVKCRQKVPHEHVAAQIKPIKDKLGKLRNKISKLRREYDSMISGIEKARQTLESKKPDMSVGEAKMVKREYDMLTEQIRKLVADAESQEENPYEAQMDSARKKLARLRAKRDEIAKSTERSSFLLKHYNYIYRTYNDRNKIKSFTFGEYIPFINDRLKHYLEAFGLDIEITLTNTLGISSNMWGYEFESGGERKRTDVAFMLAMFDFHEYVYGRQCNVIVLDEVDGRLDGDGVDALINIIKTDLAPRVESMLIISHKATMRDMFPSEIVVTRKNRLSSLSINVGHVP